ncbi:MAG: hypothetical protein ABFD96_16800 [Armatimonadia bacterium]
MRGARGADHDVIAEIAAEDRYNRERNRHLREVADWVARAMAQIGAVERILLFGSVAAPPVMQPPYARRLRRFGEVTRPCDDLDLAVWVSDLTCLKALQRARNVAVSQYVRAGNHSVAQHMVDVFLMEPGTDRYRGRLCLFNECPRPGKPECWVRRCGDPPHLRQHAEFTLRPEALAADRSIILFERQAGGQPASS